MSIIKKTTNLESIKNLTKKIRNLNSINFQMTCQIPSSHFANKYLNTIFCIYVNYPEDTETTDKRFIVPSIESTAHKTHFYSFLLINLPNFGVIEHFCRRKTTENIAQKSNLMLLFGLGINCYLVQQQINSAF